MPSFGRLALMLATLGQATLAGAASQPVPDAGAVERAIALRDYPRAVKILNAFTVTRLPGAEPNRPDPMLDRLYA